MVVLSSWTDLSSSPDSDASCMTLDTLLKLSEPPFSQL